MEHNVESIQNKIYEIRGQRVMLDFDLANAYGVPHNWNVKFDVILKDLKEMILCLK